jgi:hypothetical protein
LANRGWDRRPGDDDRCWKFAGHSHDADVGDSGDAGRTTAADFALESIGEVERFLNTLVH